MNEKAKIGDLSVWWAPQVPGKPFYVPVESPAEAKKVLDILARYDAFQYENNIKPDYCNAGGLSVYEADRTGDGWVDWTDEETGNEIDTWQPETQGAQS